MLRCHAIVTRRCHRGVIAAEYAAGGTAFRVVSGHLSLSQPLRIVQMRIIGQYLFRRPKMQTIILGDLNEWRPWGGIAFSKHVLGETYHAASAPSFPTKRPHATWVRQTGAAIRQHLAAAKKYRVTPC